MRVSCCRVLQNNEPLKRRDRPRHEAQKFCSQSVAAEKMVKIDAKGLKEIEVIALMEIMTYCHAKNEEEIKVTIAQTRASCKTKLPLEMINAKEFRGEKSTVNTQMIQAQAGAAYLDRVENTMNAVIMRYKDLLKENKR